MECFAFFFFNFYSLTDSDYCYPFYHLAATNNIIKKSSKRASSRRIPVVSSYHYLNSVCHGPFLNGTSADQQLDTSSNLKARRSHYINGNHNLNIGKSYRKHIFSQNSKSEHPQINTQNTNRRVKLSFDCLPYKDVLQTPLTPNPLTPTAQEFNERSTFSSRSNDSENVFSDNINRKTFYSSNPYRSDYVTPLDTPFITPNNGYNRMHPQHTNNLGYTVENSRLLENALILLEKLRQSFLEASPDA